MLHVGDIIFVMTYREAKRYKTILEKEGTETEIKEIENRIILEVTKVDSQGADRT